MMALLYVDTTTRTGLHTFLTPQNYARKALSTRSQRLNAKEYYKIGERQNVVFVYRYWKDISYTY